MYERFVENKKSVGYYVGGMKETALKETESKKIVLATYSMAAEALDIPSLTTLIMATPKVSIEQAIGRILRIKHNNPIVVDIVDVQKMFKNQWYKRKKFYNGEKYRITEIKSTKYSPDIWQSVGGGLEDDDDEEDADEKELLTKILITRK
jgi:superfamily II DNA or RNA helicase